MKLNDNTSVAMPIRNLLSIIIAVAFGVWAYFGVIARLTQVETSLILTEKDLEKNTEFRIKWPRGEMGSLPADSEQFMMIEHLAGELDKLTQEIEEGRAPFDQQQKLTLEFYEKRIMTLEDNLEKIRQNGHSK